jgi:DNA adenine methylase
MKYLGNKERIVNHILPIILKDKEQYSLYIEPFCGSMSVIEKVTDIPRYASDVNPFLIAMWKGLCMGLHVDAPMEIPKTLYDEYRDKFNLLKKRNLPNIRVIVNCVDKSKFIIDTPQSYVDKDYSKFIDTLYPTIDGKEVSFREIFLIGWIGFMASFNGRFYDGGYSGKTDKRDYVDEQIRNTLKQVSKVKTINTIQSLNYLEVFDRINYISTDDAFSRCNIKYIIYCDIPYRYKKNYAFGHNFDYDLFYQSCRKMNELGHKIFISEYDMPEDFKCVWEMEVTNSMHPTKTQKPIEKLFTL